MEVLGIFIGVVLFFGCIVFLLWLAAKYPPYDPQPEMQKMNKEMEDELEAYKRNLK